MKKIRNNKGQFIKGHHLTKEIRKKISMANKGKYPSKETRKKLSKAKEGKIPKNIKQIAGWNKGKKIGSWGHHSKESKQKIRDIQKGKNNSNWKGGKGKYKERYSEMYLHNNRLRRVRKRKADGGHTLGEWEILKVQYNWTCPCCGKSEPKIKLTEDHIVPLSKGGSNNIENIQPLCYSCNCKKYTKIIFYGKPK